MKNIESTITEFKLYYLPPELTYEFLVNGYSIHKGVLIVWADPRDKSILDFIDDLPSNNRKQLYVAYARTTRLKLYWDGNPPFGYEKDDTISVNNVEWIIEESLFAYLDYV